MLALPRRVRADQAARLARRWARYAGADSAAADVLGRALVVPALRGSARRVLPHLRVEANRIVDLAALQAAFGDTAAALTTLEAGSAQRDPRLVIIGGYPAFDPLRPSPRFQRVLQAYGLKNGLH